MGVAQYSLELRIEVSARGSATGWIIKAAEPHEYKAQEKQNNKWILYQRAVNGLAWNNES